VEPCLIPYQYGMHIRRKFTGKLPQECVDCGRIYARSKQSGSLPRLRADRTKDIQIVILRLPPYSRARALLRP